MTKNLRKFICLIFIFIFNSCAYGQVRLGIMPFLSRSSEISSNQAVKITDIITKNLHASPSISLIERERLRVIAAEQKINFDSNSAVKIGNLAGCQYILLGSITQLMEKHSTGLDSSLFSTSSKTVHEAVAALEARVIDVATGRVVMTFSKSGSALEEVEDKNVVVIDHKIYSMSSSSYSSKGSSKLTEKAIEAAASRLSDKIREVLVNEYPMIISVNKNNIRINRGSSSGVNAGALYKVYEEGEEIFDLNGASLGKRTVNLALLRVKDVHGEFSSVEIIDRQAPKKSEIKKSKKTSKSSKKESEKNILLHEGDKIEAISSSEAEKINLSTKRTKI